MHERRRLEEWRHMLSAPSGFPPSLVLFDATNSHPTHFFKDGREINVGDCALFQAVKAPPFIGIIRKLKTDKEGQLKLLVNWLYRPVDVKLPKGSSLEAAPNEIFYSFHRDEIPAVSLLHPCKVAFLKRGIELPQGFSSFVCRRVYDIANKRLWWLTDRDYTDDHQEEVNQLLDKTKHDMQAAVHNTARDGSSQQPKATLESAQNGPSSSQGKGKKRERGEQQAGHSKREKSVKSEDSDGCHSKRENSTKSEEISEITDTNGALVSVSSVDQVIRLMKQEKSNTNNKRKDGEIYPKRSLLARVIAATEKEECLHRFVQLGGLPILDDWLQEAHKCNKTSDSGSPRDGDKGLEELLLILLRALEKLPVDLVALKSCVVGKSVNNLRSHKNMEVQKKARKLVDTWKKRVDAEMKLSSEPMKSITSPSVSCSGKQLSADSSPSQSHLARATSGIGSEPSAKNSSGVKSEVNDSHPGEVLLTSKATKGGGVSSNASSKELHSKTAEVLSSSVKDEKSSGSSHPQSNNSQSFSSGPVKGEVNKSSVVKSVNAGAERHTSGKSLAWKNRNSSENVANSRCIDKGSSDCTRAANSSNQRLILRFPNPGRSSACVSGTPNPDANTAPISEASSPNLSEKHCNEVKPRAIHSPEGSTNAGKFEADVDEKGKTSSQLRMSRCVLEGLEADYNTKKDTPTSLIDPPARPVEVKTETTHGTDNTVEGHLSLLVSLAAAESSKAEKIAKSNSIDVKRELEDHSHALKDGESVHFEAKIDMTSCKEGERNNNAETLDNEPVRIGEDIHSGREEREHNKHIGELPVLKTEQLMVETQQRLLDEAEKSDISEKITDEKVGGIDKKAEDLKSDHDLPDRGTFEGENPENVNVCKDDDGESGIKMTSSTKKVQMEVTEASVGGEKDSLEVSPQPLEEIERKVEIDGKLEHDSDGMKVDAEIDDVAERAVSDAKLNMDSKTVAMLVEADMAPLACVDSSKLTHTALDSINVENSNKCEMDEVPSAVPEVDESAINWRSSSLTVCKDDVRGSSIAERPLFDLNEGLADEILQEGKTMPSNLSISSDSCYPADPILATTTTEGASVPEPLQCRDSVSTSAIQLADPFLTHERKRFESELNGNKAKQARAPLDIDLNIADERLSEDAGVSLDSSFVSGSSRPMLDLNMSEVSDEPKSTQVLPNFPKSKGESRTIRDFDLNDGLLFEEVIDSPLIEEPTRLGSNNNVGVSTLPGLIRVGYSINPEIGNQLHRSSLNTNNPLPSSLGMVIPPFSITKPDTMSSKRTGFSSFSGDIYSTEVLPNSFSYTGLPFGGSVYPFSSASFATNSGPLPTTAAVPPHLVSPPFGRPPYVMGVPEVSGSDNGGRWSRPSLDLNAGPDASQDGRSGLAALKRVEPESGFDSFLPGFKHIKRR